MNRDNFPLVIRTYVTSHRCLQQLFTLLRASFTGFWLGILGRDTIYLIDKYYYDSQKRYHEQGYNRGGLFTWEHKVIDTYFNQCKRILVGGAGGGREVLALCKLGYEVDGFECHPELAAFANKVLKKEGLLAKVQLVPRDECPNSNKMYNGLIVGWGVYMHIQGKKKRITFLKNMRAKVFQQSPILVSFYYRNQNARYFRVTAAIANGLRWILGRSPVELGDSLDPNYAHNFTEAEISEELRQGGFEIISYKSEEYGHAVAVASDTEGS